MHFDRIKLIAVMVPVYLSSMMLSAQDIVENVTDTCSVEEPVLIEGASVTASRVRQGVNGYSVNLRSAQVVKGKQVADVLIFLPGVSMEDGGYKVNGLSVSEIRVDGIKLTNIEELKSIPADMIDKVNVSYLASSGQMASLTGGVIDIVLRRPPQGGCYGAVTAGTTFYPSVGFSNENLGCVVYAGYKNISVYDNLSLNNDKSRETVEQNIWEKITGSREDISTESKRRGNNINNRLSLTYGGLGKSTIGGSYYFSTNHDKTKTLDIQHGVYDMLSSIDNINNYLEQEITLKSTSLFGNKGSSLNIVGDYFDRRTRNKYSYDDGIMVNTEDETVLNMYKLDVNLTSPRNKTMVWECGAAVQYITSEYKPKYNSSSNTRFYTSEVASMSDGLTPLFYISAKGQSHRVGYSIGLNWQMNRIGYKNLNSGIRSTSMQSSVNPTIQLMISLDEKSEHALMLNYKRTLDDIPYAAISSAVRWSDTYNYSVGNPDLKSPTMDMLMVVASLFRNTLNLTAVYSYLNDAIYWETIRQQDSPVQLYTMPVNLSSSKFYGLGAELNLSPLKKWRMKMTGRLEIHPEDVSLGGVYYGNIRYRQYYAMYNTFSFKSNWGGMFNVIFEPTFKTYDRTYHTVYNVGGQIYKTINKGKLQLAVTFNLLGNRRQYDRSAGDSKATYNITSPVQFIGVSIISRFSKGKKVNVSAVESGAQSFRDIKDEI